VLLNLKLTLGVCKNKFSNFVHNVAGLGHFFKRGKFCLTSMLTLNYSLQLDEIIDCFLLFLLEFSLFV